MHLSWRTQEHPAVSRAWWRTGLPAAGIVRDHSGIRRGEFLEAPWERIVSASFPPDGAGRIEWVRIVKGPRRPVTAAPARGRVSPGLPGPYRLLQAPASWISSLGAEYPVACGLSLPPLPPEIPSGGLVDLHHLIGRAVSTAAGPAMDISGDAFEPPAGSAGSGGRDVVGVQDITAAAPLLVILQAEPAPGAGGSSEPPADQQEKLALAADLVTDRVPAVLLLPAVPASIAEEIARTVNTAATARRGDAQRLLARLRDMIAPHVPPQALDDIVLFLNEKMYRR
jgi:hypothetical protein